MRSRTNTNRTDLERQAAHGDAAAMVELGMQLVSEPLGAGNVAAANWFQKAAELGDPLGMSQYAFACLQGQGVPQHLMRAVLWYRRAAQAGHAGAMRVLAEVLAEHPRLSDAGADFPSEAESDFWRQRAEAVPPITRLAPTDTGKTDREATH